MVPKLNVIRGDPRPSHLSVAAHPVPRLRELERKTADSDPLQAPHRTQEVGGSSPPSSTVTPEAGCFEAHPPAPGEASKSPRQYRVSGLASDGSASARLTDPWPTAALAG